ncbi:MAG: rod shape-determining protein MreD [Rikenellaceae bacterium]|nr:rod shape-determining protein MreD [Rikenellaceae bacterium]
MQRILEYTLMFVIVALLQVFLFDNLNLSVYLTPLVYVTFIVLLPMELAPVAVLLLGLATGLAIDLLMALPGINTIATLAAAYTRRGVLLLIAGKEALHDGGVPNAQRLGLKRYLRYSSAVVLLHGLVFFTFEALTWRYYYLTLLRTVLSGALTVGLVFCCQLLFLMKPVAKKDRL